MYLMRAAPGLPGDFVRLDKASRMSKPTSPLAAPSASPLSAVFREPAGIVCLALVLALAALAVRIAGAW